MLYAMKEIPLTQGRVAVVDDDDFQYLMQWKWCAHKYRHGYRAVRSTNPGTEMMHRVILAAQKGEQVDHADGNGLNNVRSNIRLATHAQNMQNSRRSPCSSGFKGARKHGKKWESRIRVNGKQIYLGLFKSPELARSVYRKAAMHFHGEFAQLDYRKE